MVEFYTKASALFTFYNSIYDFHLTVKTQCVEKGIQLYE